MTAEEYLALFADRYVESVIKEDYGCTISELTAMVLLYAGPPPPAKPYSNMSAWKGTAYTALLQYALGKPGYAKAKTYVAIALLYLCRKASIRVVGFSPLGGWQVEYMQHIKAARRGG